LVIQRLSELQEAIYEKWKTKHPVVVENENEEEVEDDEEVEEDENEVEEQKGSP
jgi:hypothetical protein